MTKTRHNIKADAFLRLKERVGAAKAAELLGISVTNWSSKDNREEVYAPFEYAARYHLSKIDKDAQAPKVIVTRVPADKVEVVRQFLDAVGAKHQCV